MYEHSDLVHSSFPKEGGIFNEAMGTVKAKTIVQNVNSQVNQKYGVPKGVKVPSGIGKGDWSGEEE